MINTIIGIWLKQQWHGDRFTLCSNWTCSLYFFKTQRTENKIDVNFSNYDIKQRKLRIIRRYTNDSFFSTHSGVWVLFAISLHLNLFDSVPLSISVAVENLLFGDAILRKKKMLIVLSYQTIVISTNLTYLSNINSLSW